MMKLSLLTICLLLAAGMGCSKVDGSAPAQPSTTKLADSRGGFSGKVLETMDAGDYTYVLVDTGKGKNWAAAPKFSVKVGDMASIGAAMAMPKYHSKTLNRDFDVVYFTASVTVNGILATGGKLPALPKDHPPIDGADPLPTLPKDHPPIGAAAAQPSLDLSGIQKVEGGKTVSEVFSNQSNLGGTQVKVRGKVVKYNANIMGKNWIHLRDGTGAEGSNDLLITSAGEAKVGDTVVATGVISTNKDFGSGYRYAVMMEDAKLAAE